jgi:hypothetical protein
MRGLRLSRLKPRLYLAARLPWCAAREECISELSARQKEIGLVDKSLVSQ